VLDLLGGLGVILPSVARIKPGLAVLAALGCVALMAGAIVLPLLARGRGEHAVQLLSRRARPLRRLGAPLEGAHRAAGLTHVIGASWMARRGAAPPCVALPGRAFVVGTASA
jgi:hypothetical protein